MKRVGTLSVALAICLLTACQGSANSREEGVVGQARVTDYGKAIQGRITCAEECSPQVSLYDGDNIQPLEVERDGLYTFPPSVSASRYLALSAPGFEPVLQRIGTGTPPPDITLEPAKDSRQSYIYGVTVHNVSGGKNRPMSGLVPVSGQKFLITRGRWRKEVVSDERGQFKLMMPPGRYGIIVNNKRRTIDLAHQKSMFVPLVVKRTMVD